jgi:hypothetical protein
MFKSRYAWLLVLLLPAAFASAQVVSPVEIRDPELRALQQSSLSQLKVAARNIASHHFDFPFYFSRQLDVDEKKQRRIDQHSIRFERFNGATVLAISGNYYGAYSAEKFSDGLRARQTFLHVVLPILKAVVPAVQGNPLVQGYAVEVSHHVFAKAMGMPIERAENLMVYLPQSAAVKLVTARDQRAQQAALLDARVFLNANPLTLWLTDDEQPPANDVAHSELKDVSTTPPPSQPALPDEPSPKSKQLASATPEPVPLDPKPAAAPSPPPPPAPAAAPSPPPPLTPMRDTSPQALAALQSSIQGISNHMLRDLEPQAHFVTYAPPAFIAFRHQAYLELSVATTLTEPAGTSRYKLAALAFDDHVSPLLRRVVGYFPGDQKFDGISFSTTVHTPTKPGTAAAKPLSVEFFFPLVALHCYESYDCTSQQLIDAGTVLINGERVGLTLQLAEGIGRP